MEAKVNEQLITNNVLFPKKIIKYIGTFDFSKYLYLKKKMDGYVLRNFFHGNKITNVQK